MAKKRIAIFYGDKLNDGMYDNGVWMHILGIPFLSNIEEAANYDIIIRTLWMESTIQGWSKEIRRRYPHVTQIGLSDHPLSTHISKMSADNQLRYLNDLQYLDGIMALTEEERQWYSVAVPSVPVIKAGLPFPFETYEQRYGKYFDSERKYIGLGVGASDNDRNFISSFLAFQRLQLEFPELVGVFLSIPDQLIPYCSQLADAGKNIFIQQRKDMDAFYDTLSQCRFVLNMADRNTPGRIQGEAAFFRVPVIGSNRLELQQELFPSLSTSPYDLEKVVGISRWLLQTPEKHDDIIEFAQRRLQLYNYKRSKMRFSSLLREIERR